MCSLCKAVRADDGAWVALERAAAAPGLIDADRLPVVSHGICPDCVELLEAPFAEPGADPDAPPGAGLER